MRKRVTVLNYTRLGMEITAFIHVWLSQNGRDNLEKFEEQIRCFPEVLECFTVPGDTDYLLKTVARDICLFVVFRRDHLIVFPIIHETHSMIAETEIKDTTELPLAMKL